jgi:hypothetical protein
MTALKYWWWRVWTFRKEKFKVTFEDHWFEPGDTAYISSTGRCLCIGKGYFIPCKYGKLKIP